MSEDLVKLQSDAISLAEAKSKEEIVPWEIGQHKYKGYTFSAMQSPENLDALQTFEVRDDDVYCVTYPKSDIVIVLRKSYQALYNGIGLISAALSLSGDYQAGSLRTHWICEIVQLIMVDGDAQKANRDLMATALEITIAPSPERIKQSTPGYKILEKLPSPRMIATHIPEPLCPPQWFTKNAKIIYFARNPKDLLVSAYNFSKFMVDPQLRSWDAFFEMFFRDNVPYGSWFDHVLRYWQHKDRDNFLFLKYEDLHKDLRGTITKVAKFIGKNLSDDVIESITQQCTMKGMKKAYDKIEEDNPEKGKMLTHLFGQISYLRKGVVGNWKEYFSPEQNEAFDKFYAEKLAGSGLTFDFEL